MSAVMKAIEALTRITVGGAFLYVIERCVTCEHDSVILYVLVARFLDTDDYDVRPYVSAETRRGIDYEACWITAADYVLDERLLLRQREDERKSVVSRAAHYPLKRDEVVEMVRELPLVSNRKWSLEQMKAITSAREGNVEAATGGNLKAEEILGLLVKLGSFEKLTLPAPATQALVGAEEGKVERKKEKQKEDGQKKKRDRDWKKDNKSRDWQRRDGPFQCYYCDEEGHTITRCPILEKELEEGIVKKNVNGHVCDANWNKIDFRVKGGMRAVILEQARVNKDKKKKARVNVITSDGMLPPEIVAQDDNPESQNLNISHISQKEVEEKKREKAQRELDQLIDGTKDLVKEGKGKEAAGKKRRVVLRSEAEEGISIDEVVKKLLEETEITLSWKEAVALLPKFREELKKMVERRKVEINSLRLFPQYVERAPPGTKMRFGNMSCGYLNISVNDVKVRALVDSGAEMVMEDICPEVTFPSIDDNPVKGPKEKDETLVEGRVRQFVWEHAQGVAKVLERLAKYNLTASGSKSLLFQREVMILGFKCFLEERSPDPKKVDRPMPLKTVGEVRSFLGVCSFWRIFIPGFAKIAEPLREMVRQGASLEWSDQREKAARVLQDKLRDCGVVSGVPYFDDERERPFIIEADSGPIALGGVLVQRDKNGKERPLRFESRTLNSVERDYIQFRKELLAILHCLRVFRHYVMGRRFILRTDSTAVIGVVKRHQQVNVTVSRWIAHIWTYDFVLEKVPTEKNQADGLSCVEWGSIDDESLEEAPFVDEFLMEDDDEGLPPAPSCYTASAIATSREDCWGEKEDPYLHYLLTRKDEEEGWYGMVEQAAVAAHELAESSRMVERRLNEIEEESEDSAQDKDAEERFKKDEYDGEYKRIGMVMSSNQLDEFYHERTKRTFRLRRGHLFVDAKEGLPPLRVVCGKERQLEVIAALHEGLAGGHRGADATYYKVSRLYHWDGLRDMVMRYCKSCEACQKRSSMRLIEPLYPTVLVEPGSTVHLDLITMPPGKDGMKYVLNMRDDMSGYVEAKAIRKKTPKTVVDWIEEIYLRYPFIREFVANQGSEFKNEMVWRLMFRLGVRIKFVTPYHPQANAPVERGHRTLKDAISKWCQGDSRNWPSFLRAAVYADNVTVKRTTGYAPITLWYGRTDFETASAVTLRTEPANAVTSRTGPILRLPAQSPREQCRF
ncbi:hypothetical protein CBR_g49123 [Chara braunii]|uniref:Integrase catalytic domain-containing protein n=1 Tax=Chara braunii TaxID=69332 RepID=A0A388K527_CHABU|nr:hypothetical protein CBR_g49123 [Chara braunii]|eukprot:GBG65053.1 hypothetical protein CBR_g49123 [Chara braunii]